MIRDEIKEKSKRQVAENVYIAPLFLRGKKCESTENFSKKIYMIALHFRKSFWTRYSNKRRPGDGQHRLQTRLMRSDGRNTI